MPNHDDAFFQSPRTPELDDTVAVKKWSQSQLQPSQLPKEAPIKKHKSPENNSSKRSSKIEESPTHPKLEHSSSRASLLSNRRESSLAQRQSQFFQKRASQLASQHDEKTPKIGLSRFARGSEMRRRSTVQFKDFEEVFDKNKLGKISSSSSSSSNSISSPSKSDRSSSDSSTSEVVSQAELRSKSIKRASQFNQVDLAARKKSVAAQRKSTKFGPLPFMSPEKNQNESEMSPGQIKLTRERSSELKGQPSESESGWHGPIRDLKNDFTTEAKDSAENNLTPLVEPKTDQEEQDYRRYDTRGQKAKIHKLDQMKLRDDPEFADLRWIIFPDDYFKEKWDILMIIITIYVATIIPLRLSFIDDSAFGWHIGDWMVDGVFFIDIFVNAFSAYFDNNDNLITDKKRILKEYLKGFFWLDLASAIPFDTFFPSSDQDHQLFRIARLPRIYKLFRVVKLVRLTKVLRENNKFLKYISGMLRLNRQLERLLLSVIAIIVFVHISACIWKFILDLSVDDPDNWLKKYNFVDTDHNLVVSLLDIYVACCYLIVQTIITVGYGDIPPNTTSERITTCFWMFIGVFIYSFTIGSLASLVSDRETSNALYNKRHAVLLAIRNEFQFGNKLYFRLKRAIRAGIKTTQDNGEFLQNLPANIRLDLAFIIHRDIVESIPLFQEQSKSFVSRIGPLLRPMKLTKGEYIFYQGDPADESIKFFCYFFLNIMLTLVFFIKSGTVSYVLSKKYQRFRFLKVREGYFFGEIDLLFYGEVRKYTVMAVKDCDFYVLNKKDFKAVFLMEFRNIGMEVVENACNRKTRTKKVYKEAIEYVKKIKKEGVSANNMKREFNRTSIFKRMNTIHEELERAGNHSSPFSEEGSDFEGSNFSSQASIKIAAENTPDNETAAVEGQTERDNGNLNRLETVNEQAEDQYKNIASLDYLGEEPKTLEKNQENGAENKSEAEEKKEEDAPKEDASKIGDSVKREDNIKEKEEEKTEKDSAQSNIKRSQRRSTFVGPQRLPRRSLSSMQPLFSNRMSMSVQVPEDEVLVKTKEIKALTDKMNAMQDQLAALLDYSLKTLPPSLGKTIELKQDDSLSDSNLRFRRSLTVNRQIDSDFKNRSTKRRGTAFSESIIENYLAKKSIPPVQTINRKRRGTAFSETLIENALPKRDVPQSNTINSKHRGTAFSETIIENYLPKKVTQQVSTPGLLEKQQASQQEQEELSALNENKLETLKEISEEGDQESEDGN